MTHMRYWAMSLATAICAAFIAIERFAFAPATAVWIAFGVAIAATIFSLAGFVVALVRENHSFSGLSGLCALAAGWTIIAARTFNTPTALWLAFAGGLALLLLSMRALALHETTTERVVHQLNANGDQPAAQRPSSTRPVTAVPATPTMRAELPISRAMRSWMYWQAHTGLALAGALVVLLTFALTTPGHHHTSPRWITFGIGIAATSLALTALLERALASDDTGPGEGGITGRPAALTLTAASAAIAIAMIVTMIVLSGSSARWVAFALGCALTGASLLAAAIHELTTERVRHELEIAAPAPAPRTEPTTRTPAA
jgi:hypothetical protein